MAPSMVGGMLGAMAGVLVLYGLRKMCACRKPCKAASCCAAYERDGEAASAAEPLYQKA